MQAVTDMQKIIQAFELYDLTDGEYPAGTLHGTANKDFLSKLDLSFSEKIYQTLVIHYAAQEAVDNKYPIYIVFYVKHPDFGICAWVTPAVKKRVYYKRPLCAYSTPFGEGICKTLCQDTRDYGNCGGHSNTCLL